MAFHTRTIPLPNSTNPEKQLPLFGYGSWQAKAGKVEKAIETALKEGYLLIDCAAIYGNEQEVGEGIQRSGVKREDIWITSKLWNNSHQPAEVEQALDKTLSDLGVDYLDLYLMHWPSAFVPGKDMIPKTAAGVAERDTETKVAETWAALEAVLAKGKTKNIGISNFTQSEVEELLKTAKVPPANIQLEIHPYLAQLKYADWLHSKGITISAYSPLGNLNPIYDKAKGDVKIVDTDVVKEIASKTGHTPAQVVLSWGMAHKFSVIPKSENPDRIKENLKVFELAQEDVEAIDKLDHNRRYNDPSTTFGYVFFADEKGAVKSAYDAVSNAASSVIGNVKEAVGAA